jgi:endoglucanase
MVGEWGVHNQTPHDATLALMTDKLEAYKELGFGWALWNFNGSFGIVDSGRSDVVYGNLNGYKLDVEMSELLLKYVK